MSVKTYMGAGRSIGFVWIHVLPHKIPLHCLRAQLRGRLFAEASSTSDDLAEAYMDGAERKPTDEEIEAAIGEVRKFIVLPGAYLENIIRIAFNAARRKATEE